MEAIIVCYFLVALTKHVANLLNKHIYAHKDTYSKGRLFFSRFFLVSNCFLSTFTGTGISTSTLPS